MGAQVPIDAYDWAVWRCEAVAGNLADSAISGHAMVPNGDVVRGVEAISGNGIQLDVGAYAWTDSTTDAPGGTAPYTALELTIWCRVFVPVGTAPATLMWTEPVSGLGAYVFKLNGSSRLECTAYGYTHGVGTIGPAGPNVADGAWHLFAATFSDSNNRVRLIDNGIVLLEDAIPGGLGGIRFEQAARFGISSGPVDGLIYDEARICTIERSPEYFLGILDPGETMPESAVTATAQALSSTRVRMTFSDALVDKTELRDVANYSFDPFLDVVSVTPEAGGDPTYVDIRTNEMLAGEDYVVAYAIDDPEVALPTLYKEIEDTIDANFTILPSHGPRAYARVNSSSGESDVNIQLPALDDTIAGDDITLVLIASGNSVNLIPADADTINGSTDPYTWDIAGSTRQLIAENRFGGTNWRVA